MKIQEPLSIICVTMLALGLISTINPAQASIWAPWHSKTEMNNNFKSFCQSHQNQASYVSIGKSVLQRDIWLFRFGNPNGEVVLWDAQLHGDEDYGSEVLLLIAQWLFSEDPRAQSILENNYILMIPVVNIDVLDRYNAHDINLNRNFETGWNAGAEHPGSTPFSEPETQALRATFQEYKPDFYVNLHQGSNAYFSYYSGSNRSMAQQVASRARDIAAESGLTPYRVFSMDSTGYAMGDAFSLAKSSSWLAEIDPEYVHTEVEWQRLVESMYPKCLAMFIAMCETCAPVNPQPPSSTTQPSVVVPQWICESCSSRFDSESTLRNHLIANHLPMAKTYQCLDCGAFFNFTQGWVIEVQDQKGHVSLSSNSPICAQCRSSNVKSPPGSHSRICISAGDSMVFAGFKIDIKGNLTSGVGPLVGNKLLISCSTDEESWSNITSILTTSDGTYSVNWTPTVAGKCIVKASWIGNASFLGASAKFDLVVLSIKQKSGFLVISNSSLSELVFNPSTKELSFNLSGDKGTSVFFNASIPKELFTGNPWTVSMGKELIDFDISENNTHTFVSGLCTFSSELQVTITGTWILTEFPTWAFLLFGMLLAAILVLFRKKIPWHSLLSWRPVAKEFRATYFALG